jgi:hypothetical protein
MIKSSRIQTAEAEPVCLKNLGQSTLRAPEAAVAQVKPDSGALQEGKLLAKGAAKSGDEEKKSHRNQTKVVHRRALAIIEGDPTNMEHNYMYNKRLASVTPKT